MRTLPQRETVDLMRVRCAATDPLSVKLRLSNLFQGFDLRPAALPRAAILRIRRFADPLPGRIRVTGYTMFPPEDWRNAAMAAINRIAGQAVRPYRNTVPPAAAAVVFQDEAELVACMAAAAIRGSPPATLWWSAARADRPGTAQDAVERLRESPHLIPAFAEYMAASGELVAWAAALDIEVVCELVGAVVEALALASAWREVISRAAATRRAAPAVTAASMSALREPWFGWAPEACAPELSTVAAWFAGLLLTVQRSPAQARSPDFLRAVEQWIEQTSAVPSESIQTATPSPPLEAATWARAEEALSSLAPLSIAPPTAAAPAPESTAPLRHTPTPARPRNALLPLRTNLGGLFYLVNYAIYAGYYGDFTEPLHPSLELPIWDFIELLGRALAPEEPPEDPLWQLLAELSGRGEDEPAGAGFHPPEGFESWLAATTEAARERLCSALELEDPAGLFPLLIARPARIYAGAANIDVVFTLDDLPIAIRYAGLDRDPGWVPAAGRAIAFHFE
jgi:hypothetical protein